MSWLYTVTKSWRLGPVSAQNPGAASRSRDTARAILAFIGRLLLCGGRLGLSYRSIPFRFRGAAPTRRKGTPLCPQRLLGALELGDGLPELFELLALALHDLLLGLGQEVLVHELLARVLELAQEPVGFARQAHALRVEIDESGERQ